MAAASILDRVTAVVVTYNSAHCLPVLARSLAGLPHVVVVDNGSADSSLAEARRLWPTATVIGAGANLGFGAANNRALSRVATEFMLLVNPDCVLDAAAVAALVGCADRFPEASAIGPELLDSAGRPEVPYRWASTAWASRGPGAEAPACVGFLTGACMLLRREAMQRIGGFDERFFLYYEDDDLCLRLAQQAGPLVVEPAAHVKHVSRGSVGGPRRAQAEYLRGFHHIQSKFIFQAKHLGAAPPPLRRVGYGAGGAATPVLRLMLLDRRRAARAWGRAVGVLKWRSR
jgi:GT2 family glycosyltransferase